MPSIDCPTCDGEGVVTVPVCYGGYDHAGQVCGGYVCGVAEVDCRDCSDEFDGPDTLEEARGER